MAIFNFNKSNCAYGKYEQIFAFVQNLLDNYLEYFMQLINF